ncbi:MAG: tRNA-dihydrouridine synthase family protein [Armatimonadetes bacterium]|nr:tRNA-dihydrouridine synthase family protein [Armatimonadota bacterium]
MATTARAKSRNSSPSSSLKNRNLSTLKGGVIRPNQPALVLAPMDGVTDAPMRAYQGASGAFSFAVSEFLRVSIEVLPTKVFRRDVPELLTGGLTPTGMPVQVQILGGDPDRMARSAVIAVKAGAQSIDINFGCPAPTVNRHDGGASILRCPPRIREIVSAVRQAVPKPIPVSAKVRLGWDNIESIFETARMAEEGGAEWLTIHARTRVQGYQPPVYWPKVGEVRRQLSIPVVANGDIWTIDDFRRCQDETGCIHFMIGRGALANPLLPLQAARELGLTSKSVPDRIDWLTSLRGFVRQCDFYADCPPHVTVMRLKQWVKIAKLYGDFPYFDAVKQTQSLDEFFDALDRAMLSPSAP